MAAHLALKSSGATASTTPASRLRRVLPLLLCLSLSALSLPAPCLARALLSATAASLDPSPGGKLPHPLVDASVHQKPDDAASARSLKVFEVPSIGDAESYNNPDFTHNAATANLPPATVLAQHLHHRHPPPLIDLEVAPAPAPAPIAPSPAPYPSVCTIPECVLNLATLDEVNAYRELHRQPPLCISRKLIQAGKNHTDDMVENTFFAHKGTDGSHVPGRVRAVGFAWGRVGENIAANFWSVGSVMAAWEKSTGHRANILGDFTHTGVYERSHTWTQVFAKATNPDEPCDA